MNKNLFSKQSNLPITNTVNAAGGLAYQMPDEEALAQLIATGCLSNTYYVSAKDQLNELITIANKVPVDYLAKATIYSRTMAYMKDVPAVLLAILATKSTTLYNQVAPMILDNMKMIQNLITVIRSGKVGRKSLGSTIKKSIKRKINNLSDYELYTQSVGSNPTLKDILCLVHAKPATPQRDAMFKYIFGKEYNKNSLPPFLQQLEAFKENNSNPLPNMDWQFLTSYNLTNEHWLQIAPKMNWHALRMNLNTLYRNNVFKNNSITTTLASKLNDNSILDKIKVFPYQIYTSLRFMDNSIPAIVNHALQNALDYSVKDVPALENIDKLFIAIDISASMSAAVTGDHGKVKTKITCNEVASLFAGAIAKANKHINVTVIQFDTEAKIKRINLLDSLYTISSSISASGGGTAISSAFDLINQRSLSKKDRIGIIILSDNASWSEYYSYSYGYSGKVDPKTASLCMQLFDKISNKVASAKLALIDLQPNTNTQIPTMKDVINIGGFSDIVFSLIHNFMDGKITNWKQAIDSISLQQQNVQVV